MKHTHNLANKLISSSLMITALLAVTPAAKAADATWTGATSGTYSTNTNWNPAAFPGNNVTGSSGTSTDIATFNNAVNTTISYGAVDVNLGGILFTGTGAGNFNISSSTTKRIYLTGGGAITSDPLVTGSQTFARLGISSGTGNAGITGGTGDANTIAITNNATSTSAIFTLNNSFVDNQTSGTQTLILGGANAGSNNDNQTMSQPGGGVMSVVKTGAGTWILSSSNAFTGGLFINSGTLAATSTKSVLGGSGFSGTGAVNLGDTSGANNATLRLSGTTYANPITVRSGNSGLMTIQGAGLSGTTALSGGITVNKDVTLTTTVTGDALSITQPLLGGSGAVVTVSGPGRVDLTSTSGTTAATSFAGSWNMNGANTIFRLSNADALGNPGGTTNVLTNQRPITLTSGTLQLRVNTGSVFSTATTVAGDVGITPDRSSSGASNMHTLGTLSIGSNTLTVNKGSNYIAGNVGSLVFNNTTLTGDPVFALNNVNGSATGNTTLGALSDGGTARTITKNGPGSLVLSAAVNTLTIGTQFTVNEGPLVVNGALIITGSVTVNGVGTGGILGGSGTMSLGVIVNNLGEIHPDALTSGTATTFTINNNVSFADGSNYEITVAGGLSDILACNSLSLATSGSGVTLELTAALDGVNNYTIATFTPGLLTGTFVSVVTPAFTSGYSLNYDNAGGKITLLVPEPSTAMLFIGSGAMLLLWKRRTSSR